MIVCLTCKHRYVEGGEFPCCECVECGVPYMNNVNVEQLIDHYESDETVLPGVVENQML